MLKWLRKFDGNMREMSISRRKVLLIGQYLKTILISTLKQVWKVINLLIQPYFLFGQIDITVGCVTDNQLGNKASEEKHGAHHHCCKRYVKCRLVGERSVITEFIYDEPYNKNKPCQKGK